MQIQQVPNQTSKPPYISSDTTTAVTTITTNNNNREKPPQRSLEARRAIEDYFENKRLSYLIGEDYWGDE